jgi:hypothetical protein
MVYRGIGFIWAALACPTNAVDLHTVNFRHFAPAAQIR